MWYSGTAAPGKYLGQKAVVLFSYSVAVGALSVACQNIYVAFVMR